MSSEYEYADEGYLGFSLPKIRNADFFEYTPLFKHIIAFFRNSGIGKIISYFEREKYVLFKNPKIIEIG